VAGCWFSPGMPISSINKIDQHDITEILLSNRNYSAILATLQITSYVGGG